MEKKIITVNSRKLDGEIYRSWQCEIVEKSEEQLHLIGKFENEVKHERLDVIRRGTISYEFFWLNVWYNIFRFHEPDGTFRNFYCNISSPPKFENGVLDYVDLDVDVLVCRDYSYQILDIDEFEQNADKFSYSNELRETVRKTLSELISNIENRIHPFDYKF